MHLGCAPAVVAAGRDTVLENDTVLNGFVAEVMRHAVLLAFSVGPIAYDIALYAVAADG